MSEQNMVQEIDSLRSKVNVLEEELALANQQLEWFRKQFFGRKTEQTSVIMDGGVQLSMFGESEERSAPKETITVPAHERKKKRTYDDWMSSLEIKEEHHIIKNPVCELCGAEMEELPPEKAYDELVYSPAKYHIRRHIVHKYKCPECGEKPEERDEPCHIIRAPYPHAMIPGSYCSPELLAHIIYEKYAKSVPLHRQEKDLHSKKLPLLKATMSNWVSIAAEKWCLPIVNKMHELLIAGQIIHADETTVQVLHEDGRKATSVSRMWVYCNGKMNDKSIIIFEYQPTRKGAHTAEFLRGFIGYLICDGYDAYNAVEGAKRCGCWTHNRRHFVECLPSDKKAYKTSVAAKAVDFCNRIYQEENELKELSAERTGCFQIQQTEQDQVLRCILSYQLHRPMGLMPRSI